ncbi:MAG: hypothetical protein ACLFR7_06420 [Opitutales bacterium]
MKTSSLLGVLVLVGAGLLVSGCTTIGEAKAINPETGRIDTNMSYGTAATVVHEESVDMAPYRDLILVLGGDFFREQTELTGYFERVVDREEMERLLITEDLTDLVSDVTNYISWKKIHDNYGPFLVLKPDRRDAGGKDFFQLKVIDPATASDLFVAEVALDYMWKGVNDDTVFYPLYNAFLDWMEANTGEKPGSR